MASRTRGLTQVILAVLICAASLPFAAPAQARTFLVCANNPNCDFATIAAALQEATAGDSINLFNETYAGGFDVRKDVKISGAGSDETTIQGTSAASVIRIRPGANVRIVGVTITGGGGSRVGSELVGGGILNEGQLSLGFSTVRNNAVAGGESRGGGLYSDSSKYLFIGTSVISGNRAGRGGGIYIVEGDVDIARSTIAGNVAEKQGGGIHHDGGESLQLREQCIVRDNRAVIGGGVSVRSALQILDSTVSGNRAQFWAGVQGGAKRLQFNQSTISGNIAETRGGGVVVNEGGAQFIGSTVEKNHGPLGAGISIFGGDVSLLNGSTVSGNVSATDGGGIWNRSAEITIDNSTVIDNRTGQRGGGIFAEKGGSVRLRNGGIVAGNQPDQCFPADLRCGENGARAKRRR